MEQTEQVQPMELVERYLQAVGRYLPEARRADILSELGGNLREEMEDRAERQGQPLSEEEQAEVLRRYGQPVAVAARYSSAPPLIGAEIAPFYWFTLRRVTPLVVAIVVFAQVVVWVTLPGSSHDVLSLIGSLVQSLFSFWATATLVFALVDWIRRRAPGAFVQRWDPLKLPPLRNERREGLPAHPVFDLVFNACFAVWLVLFPHFPGVLLGPAAWVMQGLGLALAPVWHTYYWLLVGFTCVQIAFKAVALGNVSLPVRRGLKVMEGIFGLALLAFLLRAPGYVLSQHGQATTRDTRVLALWNAGVHQSLVLVTAVLAIKLIWDAVRLFLGRVQGGTIRSAVL